MDDAVSILRRPDNGAGIINQSLLQLQLHLKQLWGQAINDKVPVFVVAITNSPQSINLHDFRWRLGSIVHFGLPDYGVRYQMWADGIKALRNAITDEEIGALAEASEGHSGSDIDAMVAQAQVSLWKEVRKTTSFVPVSRMPSDQYHLLISSMQIKFEDRSLLEPAQSSSAGGSESYQQLDPADRRRTLYLPLKVSKLFELLKMPKFKTVTAAETQLHKDFQESLGLNK